MVYDYAMGTHIRSHQVPGDDYGGSEALRQARDEEVQAIAEEAEAEPTQDETPAEEAPAEQQEPAQEPAAETAATSEEPAAALPEAKEQPSEPEVDAAWDEEIRRRIAEVENGAVKLVPADEVFARVRASLSR